TIFTLHNAGDGSTVRMCTAYRTSSGSTVVHKRTSATSKLTLGKGVAAACPTCSDGVRNDRETGTDCGGPACQACGVGQSCNSTADCATGICTAGICQATCNDGIQNGNETDTDCGGSCPDCGTGDSC